MIIIITWITNKKTDFFFFNLLKEKLEGYSIAIMTEGTNCEMIFNKISTKSGIAYSVCHTQIIILIFNINNI